MHVMIKFAVNGSRYSSEILFPSFVALNFSSDISSAETKLSPLFCIIMNSHSSSKPRILVIITSSLFISLYWWAQNVFSKKSSRDFLSLTTFVAIRLRRYVLNTGSTANLE